jgi:serine/threonine-protein kinase
MMAGLVDDNQEDALEQAVQRFVDVQLSGQEPDVDAFAGQYPQCEDQLKKRLQSLKQVDELLTGLTRADESDFENTATECDLVGQKLAHFEIREMIGRGGMGVVYLACDTKLDRSVAIKSMPPELMDNATARTRFQREARLLASMNHPNIAVIHDVIEQEALGYLVLEYVPGQTLAERITKGPLKAKEALTIALQVAEALAAAHEHGVIHRDLKPGNIKITPDDKVKVLDFGLAKVAPTDGKGSETTTTQPGHVIGTPAYMSPEQARGKPTDKRTDIWSFGCVLYEMLTGKAPFEAETVSDMLAGILDREPDWHALPQAMPANIPVLLHRCLNKDPRRRLRDIGDAGIEISEALTQPLGVSVESQPSRRAPWLVAALCAFAGLVVGAIVTLSAMRRPMQPSEPKPVGRYIIPLDLENPIWLDPDGYTHVTFTPDGRQLIYVAGTNEDRWLVRRPLDSLNTERLPGTDGAFYPRISPDGRSLAFTSRQTIWKVSLSGGTPERITSNPYYLIYIWEDNNTLILSTRNIKTDGLSRFDLKTRKSELLTTMDPGENYITHSPIQLVQENGTLFFIKGRGPAIEDNDLFALSLETGEVKLLVERAWGRYAPSGHLIYHQRGRLMAAPFDAKVLQITGDAINMTEQRMVPDEAVPQYTLSFTGTLVYAPIERSQEQNRELVWVNLDGQEERLDVLSKGYTWVRVSTDGDISRTQVAAEAQDRIWIYDTEATNPIRPLTFDSEGVCTRPIWMLPDNREIIFFSIDSGNLLLKRKNVDLSGEAKAISVKPSKWSWFLPIACTPHEKKLLAAAFGSEQTTARHDVVLIHLDRDGEIQHLPEFVSNEQDVAFSPDGEWLAYVAEEQGRDEVFVTTWPGLKGKWQISTEGGWEPVWSPDGETIYYRDGIKLMKVRVETEGDFIPGRPEDLFKDVYVYDLGTRNDQMSHRYYDIHPDGKRFLMIKDVEEKGESSITELLVVENWFEELKRLAPRRKK